MSRCDKDKDAEGEHAEECLKINASSYSQRENYVNSATFEAEDDLVLKGRMRQRNRANKKRRKENDFASLQKLLEDGGHDEDREYDGKRDDGSNHEKQYSSHDNQLRSDRGSSRSLGHPKSGNIRQDHISGQSAGHSINRTDDDKQRKARNYQFIGPPQKFRSERPVTMQDALRRQQRLMDKTTLREKRKRIEQKREEEEEDWSQQQQIHSNQKKSISSGQQFSFVGMKTNMAKTPKTGPTSRISFGDDFATRLFQSKGDKPKSFSSTKSSSVRKHRIRPNSHSQFPVENRNKKCYKADKRNVSLSPSFETPKSEIRSKTSSSCSSKSLTRAQQLAKATESSSILRLKKTNNNKSKSNQRSAASALHSESAWPKWEKRAKKELEKGFSIDHFSHRKRPNILSSIDRLKDADGADGDVSNINKGNTNNEATSTYASHLERDAIFATPRNIQQLPLPDAFQGHKSVRRRKNFQGPLAIKLRSLRGSIEADCLRLGGTLPRDFINDPRRQANTIMDITIIRNQNTSNSSFFLDKVVMLGYIHSFKQNGNKMKSMRIPGRGSRHRNFDKTSEESPTCDESLLQCPTFAWLCFAQDAFLRVGAEYRIYNAQALVAGKHLQPLVLCTRLCEPYPKDLPPLPSISLQT